MFRTLKGFLLSGFFLLLTGCGTKIIHNPSQSNNYQTTTRGSFSDKEKKEIVRVAKKQLGVKYKWGGKTPAGFDCSGYLTYVFKHAVNHRITGAARDQVKQGVIIDKSLTFKGKLEIGDLLYFNTTGQPYSHVGIYIGNSQFIHASSGGKKVRIDSVHHQYYKARLQVVKRL